MLKNIKKRFTSVLAALLLVGVQTFAPISAFTPRVSAAIVPTNKTGFASFPFNLSSTYTEPGGQPTASGSFTNGNVGPYVEGACIPSIIEVKNNDNAVGDIPVSPVYDFLNNHTAIENLEMVGDSATAGNALNKPRAVADNLNDYTYPGTSLSAASSFYSSNGTVAVTSSGPFGGNNDGTAAISNADTFRHYNLLLKDVDPGETVYVVFCARLGLDASEYNGSSLSVRTVQGGQENIPIPVNALLRRPKLTITKIVSGGTANPWDFSFNVSPAVNGQTTINIPQGQSSVTIDNIFPDGTFTITENQVPGYSFTNGTGTNCVFNGSTATATLTAAKTPTNASCTFTNGQLPSSITIVKDAIPNSLQDFSFTATGTGVGNFMLDDDNGVVGADNTLSNSKTFSNLTPGVYSFTEGATSGWDFSNISCSQGASVQKSGSTVTITLTADQNVSCTYTNRQRGTITVHKVTMPANDPTGFSITASGSGNIAGNTTRTLTTSQDVVYDVAQGGTYAVSEDLSNMPEWVQISNTCTNLTVTSANLNQSCTITNAKLAKLKIVKDAVPDSGQDFSFTATGSGVNNFTLDDDADPTLPNNVQFTNLTPGSFSFTEDALKGWSLMHLSCSGTQNFTTDLINRQLSVTLAYGDDVTCTFTNQEVLPLLTVIKNVVNPYGPTLSPDNFSLHVGTTPVSSGEQNTFNAGTYMISEVQQPGYTFTGVSGDCTLDGDIISIILALGDNKTCTLTNTAIHPKLIVKKHVVNNYGGKKEAGNFTMTVTGTDVSDSSFPGDESGTTIYLSEGSYSVDELSHDGYNESKSADCSGTISVGEVKTCTITNSDKPATLTIIKDARPANGQTFNFTSDQLGNFSLIGDGSANSQKTFTNLSAGDYTVGEQINPDWNTLNMTCNNDHDTTGSNPWTVTLALGDDVTCTIHNAQKNTITGSKFEDVNNNGEWDQNEPGLEGWTIQLYQDCFDGEEFCGSTLIATTQTDETGAFVFDQLDTGDYTVCEVMQDGWMQTLPGDNNGCYSFTIEGDGEVVSDVNFGNFQKGEVTGIKFNDVNGNGTRDTGEPTLANWVITLTKECVISSENIDRAASCVDTTIGTTKTDANGTYSFGDLEPGMYKVCEVMQDKWTQTFPGTADGCTEFTIGTSGQVVNADFGNKPKPQVLGATLVNTGADASKSIILGFAILGALGAVHFLSRRKDYSL